MRMFSRNTRNWCEAQMQAATFLAVYSDQVRRGVFRVEKLVEEHVGEGRTPKVTIVLELRRSGRPWGALGFRWRLFKVHAVAALKAFV